MTDTIYMATITDDLNSWVLYLSTDYVFDGKSPPYKETDTQNPLNAYGKMKLAGEKVTLGTCAGERFNQRAILP